MEKLYEPAAEQRAKAAEAMAERIFNGNYDGFEEALLFLQYMISNHYGMPFFDPYFENRSFDDLIFEAKLISLQRMPKEQQKAQVVNNNKKEAEGLFDDWEKDDWAKVENNPQVSEEVFDDIAAKFMETGSFKE